MYWFVTAPVIVGSAVFALLAITLGLASYVLARSTFGRRAEGRSVDLAINLFRIIATLVSLFLALTFADIREEVGDVRSSVQQEPAQLWNVYWDLEAYNSAESRQIQLLIAEYVNSVVDNEWPAIQQGDLDRVTVDLYAAVKLAIYSLEPTNSLQETLHNRIIVDINAVSQTRQARLLRRGSGDAPVFLYVAVLGFAWTIALLSVYPPTRNSLSILTFYCVFFGIVIYLIVSLEFYFDGIGKVTSQPFEFLAEVLAKELAR